MIDVRKEAARLWGMGFAIHWVRPKSKAPVNSGWTTGPRAEWPELARTWFEGMNLGVRLGRASKVGSGYLAVIDCDVKSNDPKDLFEMQEKLKTLFPFDLLMRAPGVKSGRGNGSAHYYIVTPEPIAPKRLAQSALKVKVKMPSVPPSRAEKAALQDFELQAGMRLRAAWEISLMGEGQQVVLPPSIHPDSGKPYIWATKPGAGGDIPLVTEIGEAAAATEKNSGLLAEKPGARKFVEVDLVTNPRLSDKLVDLVLVGTGCEDRSAALLGVASSMVKAGLSDLEIVSVLTDKDTFLGAAAFEHAKTKSRDRAAAWVEKYTLGKARAECDAARIFDDSVEVLPPLSEEAAEAQAVELSAAPGDWRTQIERGAPASGSRPKNTLENVVLILQGEVGASVFRRNEFANTEIYGMATPWGGQAGDEIRDIDIIRIKVWLAREYRFEPSNDRINEAINRIADENRFHPVRDYLGGLEWDGVPRIDSWLKDYLGADGPEPYLSAVSRKVLCAMIARVYHPGAKFDQVLILEGDQGVGKSTAIRHLAGDDWFTDTTINIQDKDAVLNLGAVWVVEMGELSGMRKADVDLLKEFVARTADRIRVPYGKRVERFPRQCVFIGTTNGEEYLRDMTGNRRFWPVRVGACDFKRIRRDRDQLFAEARFAWELGEPLYLEDPEAAAQAIGEQEHRTVSDTWSETIEHFLENEQTKKLLGEESSFDPDRFTIRHIFSDVGPLAGVRDSKGEQMRVAEILKKLRYHKHVARIDGVVTKCWMKKPTN